MVCLCCFPILQQMVQRSDEIFPHLHRLELCGSESTEAAIAKAKWFSGSLDTAELHRSSPFTFKVKRSRSLASSLAWERCFYSSLLSTCVRASATSVLRAAPGCSVITAITSAVGLNRLWVHLSRACWRSARKRQVRSLDCMSWLYLETCAFL